MNINKRNERIKQLYANGETVINLAKRYKVSRQVIYKVLDLKTDKDKEMKERMNKIALMVSKGFTQGHIAKTMGISQATVARAIRKHKEITATNSIPETKTKLVMYNSYSGVVIMATNDTNETKRKLGRYNADLYNTELVLETTDAVAAEESLVKLLETLGITRGHLELPYEESKHYGCEHYHAIRTVFQGLATASPMNDYDDDEDDDDEWY